MAEVEGSTPSAPTKIVRYKKEIMPQVSIKDQLKKLVELQAIDAERYRHKVELEEKPAALEELRKAFEEKKVNLKSLEDRSKTIQVDRKSKELELQAKEGEIAKSNAQLSLLKTNKEYQAKMAEIESFKADKSIIEEKILLLYDSGDIINSEIAKEKSILAEEEKNYLNQKKIVEDAVKEIEEKLKVLEMKRSQVSPEIDKANLNRYERVLENKKGLAIVPVKGNSCGGCFMNVPEQSINEIKMHDKLTFCEMCARILYLEDDL